MKREGNKELLGVLLLLVLFIGILLTFYILVGNGGGSAQEYYNYSANPNSSSSELTPFTVINQTCNKTSFFLVINNTSGFTAVFLNISILKSVGLSDIKNVSGVATNILNPFEETDLFVPGYCEGIDSYYYVHLCLGVWDSITNSKFNSCDAISGLST